MMKILILFVVIFGSIFTYSQEPGAKLKFGKYKKGKDGVWYVHKMPSDFSWVKSSLLQPPIDYTNAKIHYSKTFLGDTTSVSINGAYVNHNPTREKFMPIARYTFTKKVSNKEWNLFRRYVRDSIVRNSLGKALGGEWLNSSYIDNEGKREGFNEGEETINWKMKLATIPGTEQDFHMQAFKYYKHERLNNKLEIDSRKLQFMYYTLNLDVRNLRSPKESQKKFIIANYVSLFRDSTMWITDSSSLHFSNVEDGLVSYYNYHPYFEEQPVTSINTPQAKAYLKWLEINHQKQLDKNDIPLYVEYTLPNSYVEKTQTNITINQFSLNAWQVSNAAYKKFVDYVQDSLARRILAEELGAERFLILPEDDQIDEVNWSLNYKTKIDWKNRTAVASKGDKTPKYGILNDLYYPNFQGDTSLIDKRKLNVLQYFYDFKNASIDLEKGFVNGDQYYNEICSDKKFLTNIIPDGLTYYKGYPTQYALGKTLNLSYIDEDYCTPTDIYSHDNRSNFIIMDQLNVYPGIVHREPTSICMKDNTDRNAIYEIEPEEFCNYVDCELCPQKSDWEIVPEEYDFDSNPEALITNITYFQYVAYWRWRIKANDFPNDNENPVIQNYIPSKEEFKEIQNGKATSHPQEVANMPTPGFGYVVSFYGK